MFPNDGLRTNGHQHRDDLRAVLSGPWCAQFDGRRLRASLSVGATDCQGLERRCRYNARPPLLERFPWHSDERLAGRLKLPKPDSPSF